MEDEIVAIILARGGSKGVPGKNLVNIGGEPLLNHSISFAADEKIFSKIYVSSDCDNILRVAALSGMCDLHRRSTETSSDTSTSEDALREVIIDKNLNSKVIALIEPTFPFRSSGIITKMMELFESEQADCCVSVKSIKRNPQNIFTISDKNILERLFKTKKFYHRRQELGEFKKFTNGIYLFKAERIFEVTKITDGKLVGEIDEEAVDLNIDTIDDVRYANYLIENEFINDN